MRELLSLALIVSACSAGGPMGQTAGASSSAESDALRAAGPLGAPRACPAPRSGTTSRERDEGVAAFIRGDLRAATASLEAAVSVAPHDLAAQALLTAARTRSEQESTRAAEALQKRRAIALPAPPSDATLIRPLDAATRGADLKLQRVSDKQVAVLSSTEDWLKRNGLSQNLTRPRPEDVPDGAPKALGARADMLFSHADHEIVRYGSLLLVSGAGRAPRLFDASALQEVHFAQVVGRALLVGSWRNGYAKDSGGRTGYVSAFSIDDGTLLWSSEPLVQSMSAFAVTRDHVISGYGFTAEPDHLFVLELATGKTLQKVTLRSGPESLIRKGDEIHVRTYDSEAVFRMAPSPGAARPAELPAAVEPTKVRESAEVTCWVHAAVAAIDGRDGGALGGAIDGLATSGAEPDIARAFDGVKLFLDQQAGPQRGIDLTTVVAKRVAPPPWEYRLVRPATQPVTGTRVLVERASRPASPTRNLRRGTARVTPTEPFFLPPVARGALPPGAREDIPSTYGLETLRAVSPLPNERLVLVYGDRYVAVVTGSRTEAVLDFGAWIDPPNLSAEARLFGRSEVTFAIAEGPVLYVANGGGSYAAEMGGKKGYVSAVDLGTGELLWRSQPLVQGSGSFATHGGFLVTGYGFTAEPDALYLLRKDTGQVAAKHALKSAPETISVDGSLIRVATYDFDHEIEIRER